MAEEHLSETIKTYLLHLEAKGYSPRTTDAYRRAFNPFAAYLAGKGISSLARVTPETIFAYQDYLHHEYKPARKRVLSLGYQANLLKVLKGIFRYLVKEGKILSDPAAGLSMPKLPRRIPKDVLTKREVRKLLAAPETATARGFRVRAAFEILYSTGMRNRELRTLTLNDVHLDSREIIIRLGKGGKERIVPLTRKAAQVVERYITQHRAHLLRGGTRDRGRLILSDRGTPIDKGWIWRKIKQYAKACRFKKNVTTHTMRHTFATHLLKNGVSIRIIQELLGHESLTSTQIYTKVDIGDLRKAIDRAHPREDME